MYAFSKNKSVISSLLILIILAVVAYNFLHHKKANDGDSHVIVENIALPNHEKTRVFHIDAPEKGLLIYIASTSDVEKNTDYAKRFAELSYYVAVIDSESLLNTVISPNEHCLNLAETLETISDQLQAHFELDTEDLPILVGTDAGSAPLYIALAQAGEHKFHAAVSVNFSPAVKKHSLLCDQPKISTAAENTQLQLAAVKRLPTSFYIFQDKNAQPDLVSHAFTDGIGNVKLTIGEGKEQTFSEAIQILQWLDPRLTDQISSDASDGDLPLIEVPVVENQTNKNIADDPNQSIAIIVTGDGGWAEIDKNIAKILAEKGIPTVALDSLSYFWKARSPEETTQDIEAIISTYLTKWNKKKVMLIGYSFGADVLPFIANKLTGETQKKIALVALLGMGKTAAFEFRLSSWMNSDNASDRLPLLPEIQKMSWANSICIYGVDDESANCLPTAPFGVKIISMSGDHHFDEKYDELVKHIMDSAK